MSLKKILETYFSSLRNDREFLLLKSYYKVLQRGENRETKDWKSKARNFI